MTEVRFGPDGEPIREEDQDEGSLRRRVVTVSILAGLAAIVIWLLFLRGPDYTVTADFSNASQVVNGNLVVLSGKKVGTVRSIRITDDNQAALELGVDGDVAPLPRGTSAVVRSTSLSGVANRYVELIPPRPVRRGTGTIPDGGTINQDDSTAEVDLDALFNTLDRPTRQALQRTIRGFSDLYRDAGPAGNRAIRFTSPLLSTSRRLVGELNRDEGALEGLVVNGAKVVNALSERHSDVSGLVSNLNRTTAALASQSSALARSVGDLPPFMRQANETFANLRTTLDDVDPLVEASMPVARRLRPFLPQLRAFATGAIPVVRDLSAALRTPGRDNDLTELLRTQPGLAQIGVGPVNRNGADRKGALPEATDALRDSLPNLAFFRPYTPELVGWFDDFGHGIYDANGSIGRIAIILNAFSASTDNLTKLPVLGSLLQTPKAALDALAVGGKIDYRRRCPGSGERDPGDGSTPFTDGGNLDCDPTQVPVGP